MAQPISPLAAYNDLINQQVNQLSQPRGSDLDPLTMLAVAQGLLSPTRTGSFGESIGNAAGAAIGPLSKARSAEQDRMDKIARLRETQVKLALEQQRINDLNKRAESGYGYGRDPSLVFQTDMNALENARKGIDLTGFDIDPNTAESERQAELAERRRKYKMFSDQIERLTAERFGLPQGQGQGQGQPAPARPQQSGGGTGGAAPAPAGRAGRIASDDDLENARTAYQRGAPIDAIIKRFKDAGITGITPEQITGGN